MKANDLLTRYNRFLMLLFTVVVPFAQGCEGDDGNDDDLNTPTAVTDIDGNEYSIVMIGEQIWMAENLKVARYRNGDAIPTGLNVNDWISTVSGAYAYYDHVPDNDNVYGKLYNWHATVDPRGLCPIGWHMPTDAEWTVLTDYLGGTSVAGGKMKTTGTSEAGTGLWLAPNVAATNESGFSGVPGGFRYYQDGLFSGAGRYAFWWSSSAAGSAAWSRYLNFNLSHVMREAQPYADGLSVRCVKD